MSDTHGFLDEAIFNYFAGCDEVWHAGDFGPDVLGRLQDFKPLRAVYGNIDGADIRSQIGEDLHWNRLGTQVYMTHMGGYPGKYSLHARKEIAVAKPGLFITGHSHILRVMRDPAANLVHLNPGACGHQGWHTMRTILRFTIEDAKISQVEAIELGKRGALRDYGLEPGVTSRS
jgi:putative phosphoesterase